MTPEQRFRAARWGYVAVVLLATLTQLHFSSDLTAAGERLVRAFTPSLGWRDAIDGLRTTGLFAALAAAGPISFDSLPLVDLLLFAPAGFLFVMLLRERGREAGWVGVAGAGAGLALLAELGHGMLGFPIWWGAVLVRMAGVGLGAWAAQRALPALTPVLRGAARARA